MGGSYRDLIAWQKAMVLVREIYLRHAIVPEGRTLRPNEPTAQGGSFCAQQYRGRPGPLLAT